MDEHKFLNTHQSSSKGIDKQNLNIIQQTSSQGMADLSSIMLEIHFVLDPLRHKPTDWSVQTCILAHTQPITSEQLFSHFSDKYELSLFEVVLSFNIKYCITTCDEWCDGPSSLFYC